MTLPTLVNMGACQGAAAALFSACPLAFEKQVAILRVQLEAQQQGHLLNVLPYLNQAKAQRLVQDLAGLDVARLNRLFGQATAPAAPSISDTESSALLPLDDDEVADEATLSPELRAKWEQIGMSALQSGKVAIITLAGGQGTRLGSSAPKGCYDIGLPSRKSLFQIQAERIQRLGQLAARPIPWWIMTSGPTHADTEAFFRQHAYFGLDAGQVHFFQQGLLPCFHFDGRIMLDKEGGLALSPDGNGGFFTALKREGVLAAFDAAGIEHVHVYCVDNVLVKVGDPLFLGYCIDKQSDIGSKVVEKRDPKESVGLVCRKGTATGPLTVAEYSEIDPALTTARTSDGQRLLYRHANIANHYFSTSFLASLTDDAAQQAGSSTLSYHVARKKISYMDDAGQAIAPSAPNGIKLELFIFDVFPLTHKPMAILQVPRDEEFSPLKNAPGSATDAPETARRDLLRQCARRLARAGASLDVEAAQVEISPLLSYAGEQIPDLAQARIPTAPLALDQWRQILP